MERADILLTIAEIAVAFAGFASLVSVIGAGKSERRAVAHSILFRTMVLMSLMVVALALIPFVTHSFGVKAVDSWRAASGVFFVTGSLGLYAGIRWLAKARAIAGRLRGAGQLVVLVDFPAALALALVLSNLLGFTSEFAADAYVVALLLFLWGSGVCFASLLISHTHPLSKPPDA